MAGARKPAKSVASRTVVSVPDQPISPSSVDAPVAPAAAPEAAIFVAKFDTSLTDVQEYVRKSAEESLEKSREAYERFRTSAEEATASLEASYNSANKGLSALHAKTIEAFRSNASASFELIKAVVTARSLSEAIQLHNDHAIKQFETFSAQVKDLSDLAQKVANNTAEPLKSTLNKAFAA